MKIPLKWLADYVPLDLPVAELAQRLTLAGLEVSGFRSYGLPVPEGLRVRQDEPGPVWDRDKIVITRVISVGQHPNAQRLKLPVVEYPVGAAKTILTGAPNLAVGDSGQKVILALTGSVLFDGHASPKRLSELQPTTIRGVLSDSMVCSAYELGISDEHEGIILLDEDAPVGVPLADFMGDLVLEADVLPNMARCLSMVGVAREVAALTGQPLTTPAHEAKADGPAIAGRVEVVIDDSSLSPRYAAAIIEGVTVGPAPGWMQRRLTYAGMRPINNIVDVTNYVMLEWGQPLHAFDLDVLERRANGKTPRIVVRSARVGETLLTLDGNKRELTPEMLVIADAVGPIALAGVMGGAETEVSAATKRVLLESANFDFLNIRRTMRSLDLISEASQRFSKGIHPDMVPIALGRACELMRLHAGGTVAKGVVDVYPSPIPPRVIELRQAEILRLVGIHIPTTECERILKTLEFGVEPVEGGLRVTVPAHRLDIQEGPADLIEDLVRLYGYDRLPSTMLAEEMPAQTNNAAVAFEETLRDRLVALGLQEVITYALTTPEREKPLGVVGEYITLRNAISSERTAMRRTLLAGVLEVTQRNLEHAESVRFFEVGTVYVPREGQKLPDEPRKLAVVLCGKRRPEFWEDGMANMDRPINGFFDLKGIVENLLADMHVVGVTFRPSTPPMLHPGKAAEIAAGSIGLGTMGELHPKVAATFGLAGRTVLVLDLDLAALRQALPVRFAYHPIPRFQAALRDVAVIVPEDLPAERVEAEIRSGGGGLLREVRLFDLYRGDSIPAGTKSLAYALSYQADDRTLTDKDIDKAHKAVENRLRQTLDAQIRGQEA
jgi:phenylalanyl-tRNA synthetase beta chain